MALRRVTRREFLKVTAVGGASCTIAALAGDSTPEFKWQTTRVASVGGVPTFVFDDKPVLRPAFETYVPTRHYFEQFAEASTKIFGFSANAAACDYGHSSTTWIDSDTWDYSQFEQRAGAVLAVKPDAMLLPRVNLGTPRWWLQEHPEALEQLDDGSTFPAGTNPTLPKDRAFPSLASPQWRDAVGGALRRLIEHVRGSRFGPHIFGWCLSGMHTEEFYHWTCNTKNMAGYSAPTAIGFRKWLRDRYKDASALRQAWSRDDIDFDNAAVPTCQERLHEGDGVFRDAQHRNVVDFYLFWNELIPETIDYFARVAKDACGGQNVVGAFYGYMYEFAGDPEFGHNAMARFLASDQLDFMAVTASYFSRASGDGGDYARSPAASVRLHGKVWYHDNDVVSFLARKKLEAAGWRDDDPDWTRNLGVQLRSLGYTETAEKSCWMYRRGLGFALCHGMYQAWFDLHGGYFDAPELMAEVKALNRLAAEAASWDRSSIAEVLVVADEASCAWCRPRSPLLRELLLAPQNQLLRIGTPVDHVLLDDLEHLDTSRYKLVIFLNCFQATTAQRRMIAGKLKRDGRHLLWCCAAGWFSENDASVDLCRDLTGFALVRTAGGGASFQLGEETVLKQFGPSGVGVREESGWISLWSSTADMPAAGYRELARAAGVHLFNARDDVLYACRSLICLHAQDDGERQLHFPVEVQLQDVLTGEPLGVGIRQWSHPFRAGETRLFYWQET